MNTKETVEQLRAGETVVIPTTDAFVFIRECEGYGLPSESISMVINGANCTMEMRQVLSFEDAGK